MKIKIKEKNDIFEELFVGTAFMEPYRIGVFMKTYKITSSDGKTFNAVNLENGSFRCFQGHEKVIPYEDEVELG